MVVQATLHYGSKAPNVHFVSPSNRARELKYWTDPTGCSEPRPEELDQ